MEDGSCVRDEGTLSRGPVTRPDCGDRRDRIYFLWRCRLRSLRCLCLRIFLRRFLITLPTFGSPVFEAEPREQKGLGSPPPSVKQRSRS